MRLTLGEQETIINFNQAEGIAYIYTCSKPWMNHLEEVLGLKPNQINPYACEFVCPKEWIRMPRKPRRLSEKLKTELIERLPQKPILSEVFA